MVRFLVRLFLAPLAIAILDVIILVPLVIAILEVAIGLLEGQEFHEPMDIIEGMGVILIGWGVALEERGSLRDIFGLKGGADEPWQVLVDHVCHGSGLGLLIFGLFAEMCVEAVRLPNHIINTDKIDALVLVGSLGFLVIAIYVMARHIISMVRLLLLGRGAAPHHPASH
ncbi:hypothetical protein SAMN02745126_02256 [Enhydrobacter aerosaccus]|uniref:Uncharacterized protein n=1 Tax=Enhydrobacter aerosaccus TaxID=225324 RepID=A0A1T4NFK2_9HYPH|nr:hypothetical protein [Enhydrobacter aerosaccus]SJZ77777.1 hypothetical protein SAMN02745126_02256 [Enhydrobacter aerosaccus]